MNVGDGSPLGESDGDIRRGDMLREFRDDENIERAESEERGFEVAAELFDGVTDSFVAIVRIVEEALTSVRGVADLMAEVGHALPLSGGGLQQSQNAPRGRSCQERKKEEVGSGGEIRGRQIPETGR